MDRTEAIAEQFLKKLGCTSILYEPDGNVPPDFVVDGEIGVEVRRLNQLHVDAAGQVVGLEQADMPLWQRMSKFLNNFEPPTRAATTIGVFYDFGRPVPHWRLLEAELKAELLAFMQGPRVLPHRARLPCGVKLHFFDLKQERGSAFRHSGSLDRQSGGYVVGKLQFSLQHAIPEKQAKVAGFRSKYPKWWLVLVDLVSWGTDENDRRQLFDGWSVHHDFDKVYVVNPQNVNDYFEV